MAAAYGDYQAEIYGAGVRGHLPRFPTDYATLEERAAQALPRWVLDYVRAGAGDEHTQRANTEAFTKWGLMPRMMAGAHRRDLSVNLFGIDFPHPLFMCPIGILGLCSQDLHGDLLAARAAAATATPLVLSTLSQDPMEEIAKELDGTPSFFQLYTPNDRDLAVSLIQRAEAAGFRALVITLDTWITGWRPRDLNTGNFPQLRGYCLTNYVTDEHFRRRLSVTPEDDPAAVVAEWTRVFGYSLGWDDLSWIREATSLPIVLKGISHPEDPRKAIDLGVDGIYCSNHGGRQANGGLPALQTLPAVVDAAGDTPVLFDSGIRSGSDMVKALAMGATMVGTGRPLAYAMALGGQAGVEHHLRSFLAEADLLMAVNAYPDLARLREADLRRVL